MNFPVELDDWIANSKDREDENGDHNVYGLQPFYPLPHKRTNASPKFRSKSSRGSLDTLDVLFSRYRGVLFLIALRVLGDRERAEQAVWNCVRVASDRAPRFDHEGAFRCWLARILIDEAVTILYKQKSSARENVDLRSPSEQMTSYRT